MLHMPSLTVLNLHTAFSCKRCGSCCEIGGVVTVTGYEVQRISRHLGCDPDEIIAEPSFDYDHLDAVYHFLGRYPCMFFDSATRECRIHPVRPLACRKFPFLSIAEGSCSPDVLFICPAMSESLLRYAGLLSDTQYVTPSPDVVRLAMLCQRVHDTAQQRP